MTGPPLYMFNNTGPGHTLAAFNELGVLATCGHVGRFAHSTTRKPVSPCEACLRVN